MIDRDRLTQWIESLMAEMFGSHAAGRAAALEARSGDISHLARFVGWRAARKVAMRNVAGAVAMCQEFRAAEPATDHAHMLLIDAGARVCPRCGLYAFNADTGIEYRCLSKRAPENSPPCPLCEVGE